MTPSENRHLIGRVLAGVYRLDEVIATGSTAVVFRGTHVRLEQPLAIKVLAGSVVANEALISRFEAEAKVQAKLHHPHIVTVHDFVADGDVRAIAMEYVDGIGLDHLMYKLAAPMELGRIKTILAPVLEAIGYAHERGIIHRDLKPSNILITRVAGREFPKVMDFGIAKVMAEEVSVTAPGAMLGTLLFMSPEQCKALKTVDERSDVYSLGVTIYQMATGMVPFYSESAFDIMLAHVQSPPVPPREIEPTIPTKLEAVILKALEKDPNARFASVAEMATALHSATGTFATLGGSRSQPTPSPVEPGREASASAAATGDLHPRPDSRSDGPLGPGDSDTEVRMPDEPSQDRLQPSARAHRPTEAESRPELPDLGGLSAPGALRRSAPRRTRDRSHAGPAQSTELASHLRGGGPGGHDESIAKSSGETVAAVIYPQEQHHGSLLRLRIPAAKEPEWRRYFDPNIAGGGIFVPTNEPPDVGTRVRLEVVFVSGPRFFMTGVVTWRRPQLNDPRIRAGVGVQVHPTERGKLHYLNHWINGSVRDQRARRRLPIKLRIAYSGRTGRRVNFTRDLSESGIFVRSRELLDQGTPIEVLLMPTQHNSKPFRLQGRVSRLVRDPEDRGMGISLQFESEQEQTQFAAFVEELEHRFLRGELPDDMLF